MVWRENVPNVLRYGYLYDSRCLRVRMPQKLAVSASFLLGSRGCVGLFQISSQCFSVYLGSGLFEGFTGVEETRA